MSRILVVSSTFPQYRDDPRGGFLLRHYDRLARSGTTVRILLPRTAWCRGELPTQCQIQRFVYAPDRLASLTGNFGILENIRARPWRALLLPGFAIALQAALRAAIAGFVPDRVIAHMLLPAGILVGPICRSAGIEFEVHGHGTDVDVLLAAPAAIRKRLWQRLAGAHRIYLPSADKQARWFERTCDLGRSPPIAISTMQKCIEPPSRLARSAGKGPPKVLYLGRLIRQKGVDDLLQAAARLSHPVELDIAGDGPERSRLERLAGRLPVSARFHGFVEGLRKQHLLADADALCVPSRRLKSGLSEGAPLVICEALSHGLPVIATSVGGIPELCRGHSLATLVPEGELAALAEALSVVRRRSAAA